MSLNDPADRGPSAAMRALRELGHRMADAGLASVMAAHALGEWRKSVLAVNALIANLPRHGGCDRCGDRGPPSSWPWRCEPCAAATAVERAGMLCRSNEETLP